MFLNLPDNPTPEQIAQAKKDFAAITNAMANKKEWEPPRKYNK